MPVFALALRCIPARNSPIIGNSLIRTFAFNSFLEGSHSPCTCCTMTARCAALHCCARCAPCSCPFHPLSLVLLALGSVGAARAHLKSLPSHPPNSRYVIRFEYVVVSP